MRSEYRRFVLCLDGPAGVLRSGGQVPLGAWAAQAGDPPPLGEYRTFRVPVADVARITGLDLGPLPDADRLPHAVRAAHAGTPVPSTTTQPRTCRFTSLRWTHHCSSRAV
ncbi:hypothetical protein GCM10027168_69440 [Streptomyces capparidis]